MEDGKANNYSPINFDLYYSYPIYKYIARATND